MILEVTSESIRDIAAAVHSARKKEPDLEILGRLEKKVLGTIQQRSETIELGSDEAASLRNVLLRRAYEQRSTTEATDYADLAERISNAIEAEEALTGLESERD